MFLNFARCRPLVRVLPLATLFMLSLFCSQAIAGGNFFGTVQTTVNGNCVTVSGDAFAGSSRYWDYEMFNNVGYWGTVDIPDVIYGITGYWDCGDVGLTVTQQGTQYHFEATFVDTRPGEHGIGLGGSPAFGGSTAWLLPSEYVEWGISTSVCYTIAP